MSALSLRFTLSLLLSINAVALAGCAPLMIESEGGPIFNPAYRGFLTWAPRDNWQAPDQVVAALAIRAGQTVADVGAGNGYFVDNLAAEVGTSGKVYATEVQEIMLRDLHALVAEEGLANVEVVRGRFDDPTLPDECCDLVFFANVYKEIQQRVAYMRRVRAALRDGGRVAILGFRSDVRGPGPPAGVRMSSEAVVEELTLAGFRLTARHEFLSRQYFLIFEPNESAPVPVASSE